ncbi:DEAD/DEAH box helicase [Paenibacillus alkalitolerans]|uniref:DEAD/DEAH box helicase n=1 Tax=Paenibacillus alkalitolerans TaxID=2799335 RepID=UPI0018F33696|nr:SNF2-related protein [Paenibacillus alkalitolerans]
MRKTVLPEPTRMIGDHLALTFDRSWLEELESRMEKNGPWDHFTHYQLAYEAEQAGLIQSFEELQCLRHLSKLQPLPHQLDAARRVLHEMRGRAILADEVGLGKTIEAGLILKEYLIRGLVKKALILVPASLVLQWVRELNGKFGIQAAAQKKEHMWQSCEVVVASMDTAKRDPHRDIVLGIDYDMLIIDEAHKLKNKKTTNYQFVNQIRKKYCLLLTATPVQNDLGELYNLITLLKPGQLGGHGSFLANYVAEKRIPKNETALQQELQKVMIRNRRSDGGVEFTKRHVKNITLKLSPEEQELYEGVTRFIKQRYEDSGGDISSGLALVTLQREVCSSRDAVFISLVNIFKKLPEDSPTRQRVWDLVNLIRNIQANTKAEKAMELIREINDKVLIFTEYRASQEYLLSFLKQHHITAVPYRGGMNRGKKDWMMDLFRSRAQVMVATEAGGEGINLQFCHHIINFDLPWNPMRIEQRIGRVHRLGQTQDVKIYNLSTAGTIEEHILNLLHEKINMFELVIGEVDTIVERFERKSNSLESSLLKIVLESKDDNDLRERMNRLSSSFHSMSDEEDGDELDAGSAKVQRRARIGAIIDGVSRTVGTGTGAEVT